MEIANGPDGPTDLPPELVFKNEAFVLKLTRSSRVSDNGHAVEEVMHANAEAVVV